MARELVIKIFGAEEYRERLFRGEQRAGSMEPALEEIAEDMMRVAAINFSSEGRRGGGSWAFLSPSRLRQKIKKGYPEDILVAKGVLRTSVTVPGADHQIKDIYKNRLNFGSDLDSAEAHQYGTDKGLPARPFLEFIPSDVDKWVRICEDSLLDAMGY